MGIRFNVASDFSSSPDGGLVALSTANKTQMSGLAQTATLRRGKVVELTCGPFSNPATQDTNIVYSVWQQTANNGTPGAIITPIFMPALEAGSPPSAGSLWQVSYTGEPTVGNRLWTRWLNQHSAFQWYAADDEAVLEWPAVNANGLAFRAHGATADYTGTVAWEAKFDE